LTLIDNATVQGSRTLVINIDATTGDVSQGDSNGDGYKGTLNITINDNDTDPVTITSLAQALSAPAAGVYNFDLNGTTFQTYVNADGWALVAADVGALQAANLTQRDILSDNIRGILAPDKLSSIAGIEQIRFTSTSGNIDVTSTNATLISRINSNTTLHQGKNDNPINESWTGTGAVHLTGDATCEDNVGQDLDANIFHLCGNASGTHWIPGIANRSEIGNQNNNPDESFYLWVKGARATITWTGGSNNTDWSDAGNWDGGVVPGVGDVVVISPNTNNKFPEIDEIARCFDMTVQTGASLKVVSGGELIIETGF
jgi:hypothetical protein